MTTMTRRTKQTWHKTVQNTMVSMHTRMVCECYCYVQFTHLALGHDKFKIALPSCTKLRLKGNNGRISGFGKN